MRTRLKTFFLMSVLLLFLFGCGGSSGNNDTHTGPLNLVYEFMSDADGWVGDFADHPEGKEVAYQLRFAYTKLPRPLDPTKGALMLSGNNHSDDLFMFVKREVTGLSPNTRYAITFIVEFASNVADGMTGIGGSPGEGVIVKAGATFFEPMKILDPSEKYYRMNIDKGSQFHGGRNMIVIGDFSNDTNKNVYALKTVTNSVPFQARTDDNGRLWLIVGTDSGFEGITTIYYNRIEAIIQRLSD